MNAKGAFFDKLVNQVELLQIKRLEQVKLVQAQYYKLVRMLIT